MILNVHAGHNPDGKVSCGAVGIIRESTENRKVKDEVIRLLKAEGHVAYDCTCENGTSTSNIIHSIVDKCNTHGVDLDVSIHFNCGVGDVEGNGKTTGTEVLVYSKKSKSLQTAVNICERISALGFKNRGVKERPDLYFLRNTKNPALLVECCFVDDADDVKLYDYKQMAEAIVKGILNKDSLGYEGVVTASTLNIRKGTGTQYGIAGTYKNGDKVRILEELGSWGKVDKGYVSLKYVKRV